MIRNLIILFVIVVAVVLGMATYHWRAVSAITAYQTPFFHWEDKSGRARVQDVVPIKTFRPVQKRRINVGYTESVHWFRFRVVADSLPEELTLEIRNHTVDRLDLFEWEQGRITALGQTGNRLPFAQRPSPTKTFAYLLTIPPGQSLTYFLRLDKRYENLTTELTLWHTDDFEDKEQRDYFLWGIFVGITGLVVLLAFLFFAATRQPVYAYYGLYILALALRQFADTGLGFQYLWPTTPMLNHPDAVIMALWLYIPAMFQFQQHFLQLRTESKPLFWATQLLKYTFLALFVALVVSQVAGLTETDTGAYRLVTQTHVVLANIAFLAFIGGVVVGVKSADTVKKVYGIGFGIQIFGQLFIYAQNLMRYQPDGIFFVDAYLILLVNFFIDLVIFSYLLAYRYRQSIEQQRQLHLTLAQTQQQTNEAIIDLLESERQQVGNLLMTDVGGRLTDTRALLSGLAPSPLLTEATGLIAKTDASLDQILRNNLPSDLTQKGLATALTELVEQCCQTATAQMSFRQENHTGNADFFLSAMQTRQLYRITNELINNIVKHANAGRGQVVLAQTPAGWQLTVSDNGRGFDVARAQTQDGIGLKNLRARAQTLDAAVQFDSGPGGTTITVLIPQKIQTS